MSLLTRTTSPPSASRFRAQARILESLLSVRNPTGRTDGSVWFSSTCRVPPSVPIGTGWSRRPYSSRRSSSIRSDSLANHPNSWWCRFPSSSLITTRGSTTRCSANLVTAQGSDSSTDVSSTNVRTAESEDFLGAADECPARAETEREAVTLAPRFAWHPRKLGSLDRSVPGVSIHTGAGRRPPRTESFSHDQDLPYKQLPRCLLPPTVLPNTPDGRASGGRVGEHQVTRRRRFAPVRLSGCSNDQKGARAAEPPR